ncbi:testis-expressed protein 11 [Ochotona curzoniae]|uniref:testis-expressed protein 11 n=1 Tax=Ochotona curzoniae TaxID=130825 RepID=UPI001B34DF82|nr:testis-expressed protein 11 [Ochotona curzoniae]
MRMINYNSASYLHFEEFGGLIEKMAINLWNWTVAKQADCTVSDEQKAKARHVACKLLSMCDNSMATEDTLRRQIYMEIKAGKAWIDTGNAVMSDEFFEAAIVDLEQLYAKLVNWSYTEVHTIIQKFAVEKDLFKVYSYQAESAFAQGNFQRASTYALRCKDMLYRFPKLVSSLHVLCYNFGVEMNKQGKFQESSFWLRQSFDIGKMNRSPAKSEMNAKVLRLLATNYLEWDYREHFDKAVTALALANKEHLHPAGLCLKMKLLLKGEAPNEELLKVVKEIQCIDMPLDMCVNVARLLMDHDRESIGFHFLEIVCEKFKSSENSARALLFYADILLERKEELQATEKIEEIVMDHQAGRKLPLDLITILQDILWKKAARSFEAQDYEDALHWFNYSLEIYESDKTDLDVARLQRNMASCYMRLNQYEKANRAMMEAELHDPQNISTQLHVFKVSVLEGDCDRAFLAIENLKCLLAAETPDNDLDQNAGNSALSSAAQFALEHGQQFVAVKALEYLAHYSEDPQQVITSLKCLFRIVVPYVSELSDPEAKKKEMDRLLACLNRALVKIAQYFRDGISTLNTRINEAHWFRKIAWNLAVQTDLDSVTMRELFVLSYRLSLFCPSDQVILIAQKTCLVMAISLDLEEGRQTPVTSEQIRFLARATELLDPCRKSWNLLKQTGDFSNDPCETLLLLYEFEIKTKMNDPSLDSFMEVLWEIPNLESRTYEIIASLAVEKPAFYPSIAIKALKRAFALRKREESVDVVKYSTCVHNLIHLLVPEGTTRLEFLLMEEIWNYFEDALRIMSTTSDYPEEEVFWLMNKSWKIGIRMFKKKKYLSSEKWCTLAMRFIDHLGSLKENHEAQMNVMYAEMMQALEQRSDTIFNERIVKKHVFSEE